MPSWELDERGSIRPETIQVSIQEIWRNGWHARKSHRIPIILREAVKKAIDDYERLQFQAELIERRGPGRRRLTEEEVQDRLARADAERMARMHEKSRG